MAHELIESHLSNYDVSILIFLFLASAILFNFYTLWLHLSTLNLLCCSTDPMNVAVNYVIITLP
jgi:hypothetical protein